MTDEQIERALGDALIGEVIDLGDWISLDRYEAQLTSYTNMVSDDGVHWAVDEAVLDEMSMDELLELGVTFVGNRGQAVFTNLDDTAGDDGLTAEPSGENTL